jgi:hypothetical protein
MYNMYIHYYNVKKYNRQKEVQKLKGYKYRIYPTKEQQEIIDKTFNCCRYVWNGFLALKEFRFKEFGEK